MFRFRYFKKFILSSSATVLGAGGGNLDQGDQVDQGDQGDQGNKGDKKDKEDKEDKGDSGSKKRPTDLPIYGDPKEKNTEEENEEKSKVEKQIGKIREEVWIWYDHVKGYREKVVEVIVTGKEHSEGLLRSLRNEELPVPRTGAIAISGLAGVILGLRGGWFKRIVYGTTGAGIMAAICYPKEAKEITQEALATSKKYVLISYNFIYGVKPDNFKLPSPSDLLGSSFKTTEKGKDDRPSDKTVSGNSVRTSKPVQEAIQIPKTDLPTNLPADSSIYSPTESPPQSPKFPTNQPSPQLSNEPRMHPASPEQEKGFASDSFLSHRLVEESADVMYWGFRLGTKETPPRQNDQSDPADKDLYTNRKS